MNAPTFAITRVVFGENGFVEFTNTSTEAADPDGLNACQFPSYPPLPGGELQPGESVRIEASQFGGLKADDGEVGLYLEPAWEDPDAIIGYVQWGGEDHKRSPVAVEAGVWESGTAVSAAGSSELRAAAATQSPGGWEVVA